MGVLDVFSDLFRLNASDSSVLPSGGPSRHKALVARNKRYITGEIFDTKAPDPDRTGAELLLYPVRINVPLVVCRAMAGIVLGQYPEDAHTVVRIELEDESHQELWDEISLSSFFGVRMIQAVLDAMWSGGAYFQIKKRPLALPQLVYRADEDVEPIWDPDNVDELIQVTVRYKVTRATGEALAGELGDAPELVEYVDFWSRTRHVLRIHDKEVINEANPFTDVDGRGLIPFVYLPTYRIASEFYGVDFVEPLRGVANEINERMRDTGDSVEASAHPQLVVRNYKGSTDEIPRGPDEVINLGISFSKDSQPDAWLLDGKGVHQSAFAYLEELWRTVRYIASITPVDFGEDEGSQRSGTTLEVRKMPAIQVARMIRANFGVNLLRLVQKTFLVHAQTNKGTRIPDLSSMRARWYPFLPRDHEAAVQEVFTLSQLAEPRISLEEAMEVLDRDDPDTEIARIRAEAAERAKREEELAKATRAQAAGGASGSNNAADK